MSEKSCQFLYGQSLYTNGQDCLVIQYKLNKQQKKIPMGWVRIPWIFSEDGVYSWACGKPQFEVGASKLLSFAKKPEPKKVSIGIWYGLELISISGSCSRPDIRQTVRNLIHGRPDIGQIIGQIIETWTNILIFIEYPAGYRIWYLVGSYKEYKLWSFCQETRTKWGIRPENTILPSPSIHLSISNVIKYF